jgi:hypothetical protein
MHEDYESAHRAQTSPDRENNMKGKIKDEARKLIARAWADVDFKAALIKNPRQVLAQAGLLEPEVRDDPSWNVAIVEGDSPDQVRKEAKSKIMEFWLPRRPTLAAEISDEQLERASSLMATLGCPPTMTPTSCCCDVTAAPSVFD